MIKTLRALAHECSGHMYCDELLAAIESVTDNDDFREIHYDRPFVHVDFLIEEKVNPIVFRTLSETVRRNAKSPEEADEILTRMFAGSKIFVRCFAEFFVEDSEDPF